MKRFLIVIAFAAVVLAGYRPTAAQGTGTSRWKAQNPSFPLVGLNSVACSSAAVCVAGGDDRMFSTQDGGAHWHHTKVDKGSQIRQIVCASANACLGLDEVSHGRGLDGVILRSQDGGRTWKDVARYAQIYLAGASCPTPAICYAMGTKVPGLGNGPVSLYRSNDGGESWTQVKGEALYQVAIGTLTCTGATQCYLGALRDVLVTHDGGLTWSKRPIAAAVQRAPGANIVNSMSCLDANHCYATLGQGAIIGTKDGWATSRRLRSGTPGGQPQRVQSITCPTVSVCYTYAFSFNSPVLVTTNGGASWKTMRPNALNGLQSMVCATATSCIAVGGDSTILSTSDSGATWRDDLHGSTNTLSSVSCADASTCTAVGANGTIMSTTDGGGAWKVRTGPVHGWLSGVSCPTATICYAVGGSRYIEPGGPAQGPIAPEIDPVILRTSDGGTTWTVLAQQQIAGRPLDLAGIACPATGTCFATTDSGSIVSTTDGGQTWHWAHTGAYFELRGITCPSTTRCMAVGGLDAECNSFADSSSLRPNLDGCDTPEEGAIFVTQDGGATWQRRFYRQVDENGPVTAGAHLYSVACASATTCIAAGHNVTLKTVDGGETWKPTAKNPVAQSPGSPWPSVVALACPSSTTCWASSGSPTFSRTEDAGDSWAAGPSNPKPRAGPVTALTCPTADTCYAVGGGGLILRLMGAGG